jgi:hypothetical protein
MRKRKAIVLAPLAIAAAALPAVWMGSASATGTGNRGLVHIYQVDNTEASTTGTVTLTGAIGDFGTDHEGTGPNGTNLLKLSKGNIDLDLSKFGKAKRPLTKNPSNCSYTSVVVGTVTIVPNSATLTVDTGAYKNVNGSFQVKATFAGVVPRVPDGSACDFSQENSQKTGLDFVSGKGALSGLQG